MSTPKEEVEKSLVMTQPNLKPDRTTTQAPKAPAAATTKPVESSKPKSMPGYSPVDSFKKQSPAYYNAAASAVNAVASAPMKAIYDRAKPVVEMVGSIQRNGINNSSGDYITKAQPINPNASEVMGTTIQGKFVSNAQQERAREGDLGGSSGPINSRAAPRTMVAPVAQVAQNANGSATPPPILPVQMPPPPPAAQPKPLLAGDRNTFTGSDKVTRSVQPGTYAEPAAAVAAPTQTQAPIPQRSFLAPAPSRVTDQDRAKYMAEMSNIMSDPNARLSPTLARAKADLINGAQDGQYAAERSTETNRFGLVNTDMNNVNALDQESMRGQNQRTLLDQTGANQRSLEELQQSAPKELTNAEGDVFTYRPGGNATPVTDADGKQIRGPVANQANSRLKDLNATYKNLLATELPGAPPSPQMQEIMNQITAELEGGSSKPTAAAPYPDGHRLTGPDGKKYVVKNGRPELVK